MDFSTLLKQMPNLGLQGEVKFLTQSLFPIYFVKGNPSVIIKIIPNPSLAQVEFNSLGFLNEKNLLVPFPYLLWVNGNTSFLVMEYIQESGQRDSINYLTATTNLYSIQSETWGWHENNYIGSLPQINVRTDDFYEYFWDTRWKPQLDLTIKKGLLTFEHMKRLERLLKLSLSWGIGRIVPRLIHGDLWAGNALWNPRGMYLIDPCLSFGHPEQDLAMGLLFGGFPNSEMPKVLKAVGLDPSGFKERVPFWQIYPLLVHVNLFGSGYISQLERAISSYLE